MSATLRRGATNLPVRPLAMWAPYRYGVFSWLQQTDDQIADTIAFLRSEIMKGVTDGSDARPGEIGEFLQMATTVSYPEAHNVQLVGLGTLPAGDWDCWALCNFHSAMVQAEFNNIQSTDLTPGAAQPLPPGMTFIGMASDVPSGEALQLTTNVGRALLAAPLIVRMRLITTAEAGSGGGTSDFSFMARRVR